MIELLGRYIKDEPMLKKAWVESFDEMIVHSRKVYPEKISEVTRPNETDEIKKYKKAIYEPITHAPFNNAVTAMQKIVHKENFDYSQGVSDELKEFLDDGYVYEFDSLQGSEALKFNEKMNQQTFRFMLETGNGLVFWIPLNYDDISLPPSQNDSTKPVKIGLTLVEPQNIKYISSTHALIRLKNKVVLKTEQSQIEAYEYMAASKEQYVKFEPYITRNKENKEVVAYREVLWYSMVQENGTGALDILPVLITKGIATKNKKGQTYYESFFSGFVPYANKAIAAIFDDDGVRAMSANPAREVKWDPCGKCEGKGTAIDREKGVEIKCTGCAGTGFNVPKGPYAEYLNKKPSSLDETDWYKQPALKYITPDTAILQHSLSVWQLFIDFAERQVNVKYIDQAQSGVSKDMDREHLTDLRMQVAMNWYGNIIHGSLWTIEGLLKINESDRVQPSIIEPKTSDLQVKNKSQLIEELKHLKDSGASRMLIIEKTQEIVSKTYPNDMGKQKFLKAIIYYDPLFGYSDDAITKIQGLRKDKIRHQLAENALFRIMTRDKEAFEKATIDELSSQIETELSSKLEEGGLPVQNPFNVGQTV
jgi:hypothetical protein